MMRLHEIPAAMAKLQEVLEESGGELTQETAALWDQVDLEGPAKVEAAASVIKAMDYEAQALATEIGRLDTRKTALENSQKRLRELMLPAVDALGGKVKGAKFTVYSQTRKSYAFELKPGREMWELDARWFRTRDPELNRSELKKAADAGEVLPDALAVVPTSSTSLVIR
jgi:outer membrane protein assembly factor BamB